VPTKVKNEQKGAYGAQNDSNRGIKIFWLRKYYKVPRAYETFNPGLEIELVVSVNCGLKQAYGIIENSKGSKINLTNFFRNYGIYF